MSRGSYIFLGHNTLVTGASSGIGLEYCRQLADLGANLLMVSNVADDLQRCADELRAGYGVRIETLCIDLTDADCATRILDYADSIGFDIEVLINNAGIFSFNELLDTPEGKVNAFIDLHMRAVTALCMAVGKRMRERRYGYILNMSSMSCWMPMPGLAMYAATKAYIRVMSRSLAYEMRDYGVKVCVACPGGIATSLFGLPDRLMRLALRLGAVDTTSNLVRGALNALAKGKQQYINGIINHLAIPFVAIMPTPVRMLVKHHLLDKGIKK